MLSELLPVLPELAEVTLFGAVTLALSVGGLYAERFALLSLQSGETTLGAWATLAGFVLCGFAFLVGRDKFHPSVGKLRAALTEE